MQNLNDYRVGDKVVIAPEPFLKRKGIELEKRLERQLRGTDRIVVLSDRVAVLGKDGETRGEWDVYKSDGIGSFTVPEAAILGHAFKWNEKIQVSDLADSWDVRFFLNYLCGCGYPFQASICPTPGYNVANYRYARPIREKEEKPQEPEVFWGEKNKPLNGLYQTPTCGCYPERIADTFENNPDWEFHGFWDVKCEVACYSNGRWHAEMMGPRGVVRMAQFAKFVRREKP
jgi:hypothetical protein